MPLWMDFVVVSVLMVAVAVWTTGAGWGLVRDEAGASERRAWWQLAAPLFAGGLVIAFLTGWALQETNPSDEWLTWELAALAAAVGAVWSRALVRSVRSLLAARWVRAPIATVGLWRCRTVVSPEFRQQAAPDVLEAALAHEEAHARHRDPLRIWWGQLAADLQWPVPGARRRFRTWLLALEMQRDDEAIAGGASPLALAEGLILAVSLQSGGGALPQALMTGHSGGLAMRVHRLMLADVAQPRARRGRTGITCFFAAIAVTGAIYLGSAFGDLVLMLIPGVER